VLDSHSLTLDLPRRRRDIHAHSSDNQARLIIGFLDRHFCALTRCYERHRIENGRGNIDRGKMLRWCNLRHLRLLLCVGKSHQAAE